MTKPTDHKPHPKHPEKVPAPVFQPLDDEPTTGGDAGGDPTPDSGGHGGHEPTGG